MNWSKKNQSAHVEDELVFRTLNHIASSSGRLMLVKMDDSYSKPYRAIFTKP